LSARLSLSPEEILAPIDVARLLGVHPQTVHNWRSIRRGPEYFKLGPYVFYERAAVERWLRESGWRPR
jgi:hypothetical protein